MQRDDEIELWDAADELGVSEESIWQMIEKGTLKCRRAEGTIYLLTEQIDDLVDRQIEEVRSSEGNA